jgi:hypothetical protein
MLSRQLSFLNIRFVVKKATLQSKMCKISEIKAIIQSAEAKTLMQGLSKQPKQKQASLLLVI